MLQQSFEDKESDISREGHLRFNGKSVDLGNYATFVSGNDEKKDISISLTLEGDFRKYYFEKVLEKTLSSRNSAKLKKWILNSEKLKYDLVADFRFTYSSENQRDPEETSTPGASQGILHSAKFKVMLNNVNTMEFSVERSTSFSEIDQEFKNIASQFDYLLVIPTSIFNASGGEKVLKPILETEDGNSVFIAIMGGIIPRGMFGMPPDGKYKIAKSERNIAFAQLPPFLEDALTMLRSHIKKIHYLGPLRAAAKRYYVLDRDIAPGYDHAGEFLPYILRDRMEQKINFPLPSNITSSSQYTLKVQINHWMHYLRTGELMTTYRTREVDTSYHKNVLGELMVTSVSGKGYALADSGFGYSQVLPIIVRGLLSEKSSTFIVEQPELHLHPALQVRLALFFVAMSLSGRTVLLESHSEHLVNSFRILAAEHSSNEISEKLSITFICAERGKPEVHDMSVRPDGTIPEWPKSFFGEAIELATRLLKAQKGKRLENSRS
ncbi:hypothetical protein GCM10022293_61850 [Azospirillum formosense]